MGSLKTHPIHIRHPVFSTARYIYWDDRNLREKTTLLFMTTIWNRFPWLSLRLWRTHLRTKKHLLLCQKLFFNDISYLDDGVYNQVKEKLVLTVFGPARASTTLLATASKQPSASFCSSRLFYYYLISNTGICIKMKTTILILGI